MATIPEEIPEVDVEAPEEEAPDEEAPQAQEVEAAPAPKRRGRPKGSTDTKPRASRKKAETPAAAQPVIAPVMEEKEEEEAEIEPAPPPPRKPRAPQRKPPTPESSPEPTPRKSRAERKPRAERKQRTPDSSPEPPLTYLEVLTKGMQMARQAERNEKVARYDAFFQPRR